MATITSEAPLTYTDKFEKIIRELPAGNLSGDFVRQEIRSFSVIDKKIEHDALKARAKELTIMYLGNKVTEVCDTDTNLFLDGSYGNGFLTVEVEVIPTERGAGLRRYAEAEDPLKKASKILQVINEVSDSCYSNVIPMITKDIFYLTKAIQVSYEKFLEDHEVVDSDKKLLIPKEDLISLKDKFEAQEINLFDMQRGLENMATMLLSGD